MKTLLIPVDASATCLNALKFAADMSQTIQTERIILLKSFYVSVYAQLLPSADFVHLSADYLQQERQEHEEQLKIASRYLLQNCHSTVKVEIASSEEPLLRALNQLTVQENPAMILVGTNGEFSADESDVGQQVVAMAKTSPVPVLVIPHHAQYRPLTHALVPCDFNAVSRLGILKELQNLKLSAQPQLSILSVDPNHKYLNREEEHTLALKEILESYRYQVFYSHNENTVQGILNFADEHQVELIIALPGKHSFFYNLTHQSITAALALNAHLPILILK